MKIELRGGETMTATETKILLTFAATLPKLTELEREKLESYGEGLAAAVDSRERKKKEEQEKTGA